MNYAQLSRALAHALRHAPEEYGLNLATGGWVAVDSIIDSFRRLRPEWRELTREHLEEMMAESPKQRYELEGGRIRALHGHSVVAEVIYEMQAPPEILFIGASSEMAETIRKDGLKPAARQQVHLSPDIGTAVQVGKRHCEKPVILRVRALEAHCAGFQFSKPNKVVWLADEVPAEFIEA